MKARRLPVPVFSSALRLACGALLSIVVSAVAVAAPALPFPATVTPAQARLAAPFVELGAMDSAPEEALEPFLLRVAAVMDAFTDRTAQEACGVLLASRDAPRQFRVRLTTNRAQIACVMVDFDEEGWERVGPDIHSHPHFTSLATTNAQDAARRKKQFACGVSMNVHDAFFSAGDFARGPGYLVARNRLLFQHGANFPARLVGEVEPRSAVVLSVGQRHQSPAARRALASHAAAAWLRSEHAVLPALACPAPG